MTESETILETDRLILQTWTQADLDALFPILHDADVVRYISDGQPFDIEKTKEFLAWAEKHQSENGFCRWKIIEKSSSEIIGSCGFARPYELKEVELGYLLAQKSWGKGFAVEAARAVSDHGFIKLKFREIIALTDSDNIASHKVLEKIGFKIRGIEVLNSEENLVYLKKKSDE